MTDVDPQYLQQRILYVPYEPKRDSFELGIAIARHVRDQLRLPMVVIAETHQSADNGDLDDETVITDADRPPHDGGVILAWLPTHVTLAKLRGLQESVIVAVEFDRPRLKGWAKMVGAYDVYARATMTTAVTAAGREIIALIADQGYNGWRTASARAATIGLLEELDALGELEPDVLLAMVRDERGPRHAGGLVEIIKDYRSRERRQ